MDKELWNAYVPPGPTSATMAIAVPKPLKDSEAGFDRQVSRRLFDANDPESTGIVRFRLEALDDQSPCGTTEARKQPELSRPMVW
jgi:hypothetical protein